MIVVTDQLELLIAKWFGTKTVHTKLCIGLQGFACFSKMGRVSAGMTRYIVDLKCSSYNS
ncbi:hypothetical protein DPD86_04980 [Salmonella enterica subsp. enterica serovar Kuessel]|nr:hypothetical protein [Salmonella enterica subsp. enterica serovar Moroto]EBF9533516.1 hypothetical protein [Salmonella enterica subsp. enterica serovar Ank]EBW3235128.1 hypothetical protein [Salmonella enterica subsp. enterica serovar Kuessel]ECC3649349.1 hypothetical protein [Salmonella enterica subsp. enterica]ECI7626380.1 hypothetical protein [Salmonella enterica subsp. enterica serovar Telaviv]